MKKRVFISAICLFSVITALRSYGTELKTLIGFEFFGDSVSLPMPAPVAFNSPPSDSAIKVFYAEMSNTDYQPVIDTLLAHKERHQLSDWLYYQLIRKAAEQMSPKAENYFRYTLYKWFLLGKSGYDARLALFRNDLLFYIQTDENIYDIPYFMKDGRQYVCLNIHDYGKINFEEDALTEVPVRIPEGTRNFSYKISTMPDFTPETYTQKDIQFKYRNKNYHFRVMLNDQVGTIFKNYPVVDYESYFNIPLNNKTYNSLIPELRKHVKKMKQEDGVDYLMEFTRNAFSFETDQENFGKEKRLSPEQTLLYDHSDCDDRAALFFYLVKEIYNLPMIALLYPTHVTIAVKFDKPLGEPVIYKDMAFTICEPTPQSQDLKIGELSPGLRNVPYQVAYEYIPENK